MKKQVMVAFTAICMYEVDSDDLVKGQTAEGLIEVAVTDDIEMFINHPKTQSSLIFKEV